MTEVEVIPMDLEPLRAMTELLKALEPMPPSIQTSVARFLELYASPMFITTSQQSALERP